MLLKATHNKLQRGSPTAAARPSRALSVRVSAYGSGDNRKSPAYPPIQRGEGGAFRTADDDSDEAVFWEREDVHAPLAGEWPPTYSIGEYEGLALKYKEEAKKQLKSHYHPHTPVYKVMATNVMTVHPDDTLDQIKHLFSKASGFPVVTRDGRIVGMLSKSDLKNKTGGPDSLVRELMTKGAWVVSDKASVEVCAAMMLKHKVHRLPVLDSKDHLAGIITRTDVFTALAQDEGADWHRL